MEEYKKYEPIFGFWYLKRLLGKGSFGKVFEITREEFGTTYRSALKIISVPQDEAVGQDYMEIQKTRGDQGPEEYLTWTDIGDSGEAGARFHGAPDYNETRYYGYICEWDMEN